MFPVHVPSEPRIEKIQATTVKNQRGHVDRIGLPQRSIQMGIPAIVIARTPANTAAEAFHLNQTKAVSAVPAAQMVSL